MGTQTARRDNTSVITVYLLSLLLAFSLLSYFPYTFSLLLFSLHLLFAHLYSLHLLYFSDFHFSIWCSTFTYLSCLVRVAFCAFFFSLLSLSSSLLRSSHPSFSPFGLSLCMIHAFSALSPSSISLHLPPPSLPSRAIQCGRVGDDVRDAAAGVSNSGVHIRVLQPCGLQPLSGRWQR